MTQCTCPCRLVVSIVMVIGAASSARADIFQWEYIDPADPSQGKRQSTTLCPDGAGVDAVPGANLGGIFSRPLDLTMAYLDGADLSYAGLRGAKLQKASFHGTNLQGANFSRSMSPLCGLAFGCSAADVTDADFTGSEVRGANFADTRLTLAQLYSTASYQAHDLAGIGLQRKFLSRGNFASQRLTNAIFSGATLTNADFAGADVRGAAFNKETYYGTGITLAQLYSTASYQAGDLNGINFAYNDSLAGGDFSSQNLTNSNFDHVELAGADFSHAEVRGATFGGAIILTQLYSTASYLAHDLSGIDLTHNQNLSGGDFSGQNLRDSDFGSSHLTGASFREANLANANFVVYSVCNDPSGSSSCGPYHATLTGADLSAADARGARGLDLSRLSSATTTKLIWPDGHISGLDLEVGSVLIVRDYDGLPYDPAILIPITVDQRLTMSPGGTLRMVFEADAWDSTISFSPGIPVTLGGTLELTFADDVNLATQVGRTFDLFNWTGVHPTGVFAISGPYTWDLSNLYATGEVRLTAIPEPGTLLLLSLVLAASFSIRHVVLRRRCRVMHTATFMFPLLAFAASARADIFKWEYVNPADTTQGKRQSTTLAPDGAGVDAVPGAYLDFRNLTMGYLSRADLTGAMGAHANLTKVDLSQANLTNAHFFSAALTDADLSQANLTNAYFLSATLTGADVTNAEVDGATFSGMTLAQLYSTANYQAHDLHGISLYDSNLAGGNFAGHNLTNVVFSSCALNGADFTNAEVRGAYLGTITAAQLYSTASYRARDLSGIQLAGNDLTGWNFATQNLSNAHFDLAALTGASFSHANLTNSTFSNATLTGTDFTEANLTSAYFYRATLTNPDFREAILTNANFEEANLTGVNFSLHNLSNANFYSATLTRTDFTDAAVRGANFSKDYSVGTGITLAQLYSTASYQAHVLSGIGLQYNNLAGGSFASQNLTSADFSYATLTSVNFGQSNLSNADFTYATLTSADFSGADVRGANFQKWDAFGTGITLAQLYSTASYQARDTSRIDFSHHDFTGGNFAGQKLTGANFLGAMLTGADFTDADVRGARFTNYFSAKNVVTLAQLYSTASYKSRDLNGIDLSSNNLADGNFVGQNLTNSSFGTRWYNFSIGRWWVAYATLTGADFTGADARGAQHLSVSASITANLIRPDGHINNLDLNSGGLLVVRDYDGGLRSELDTPPIPITVDQHLAMGPGGTLRMVFEADAWGSTISFAPGIPVTLGGTLELKFADDVNVANQVGRTLKIFDWTGVTPTGAFAISSPYAWDLSNLYTTGEIALTALPEPNSLVLVAVAPICGRRFRSRKSRLGDTS